MKESATQEEQSAQNSSLDEAGHAAREAERGAAFEADLFATGLEVGAGPSSSSSVALASDLFSTGRVSSAVEDRPVAPEEWRPGALILGRYELRVVIGRGGMGEVWEACDLEQARVVALKRLGAHLLEDERSRHRFEREVMLMQKFEVEGIVRVLDFYPRAFFFVMEKLQGESLREALEGRGRLSLSRVLTLFGQITDALKFAHDEQLVHRDLKPENIFLCGDNLAQVKLLDFGIAFAAEETRLTSHQGAVGTAYYMAPEQLHATEEIGPAADIFACGVIFYEMLVGRIPTGRARSLPEQFERLEQEGGLSPEERLPELRELFLEHFKQANELYLETAFEEPSRRCTLAHFSQTVEAMLSSLTQALEGAFLSRVHRLFEQLRVEEVVYFKGSLEKARMFFGDDARLKELEVLFLEVVDGLGVPEQWGVETRRMVSEGLSEKLFLAESGLCREWLKKRHPMKRLVETKLSHGQVSSECFGGLQGRLALAVSGKGIELLHWGTGKMLQTLKGHTGLVMGMAFHPREYELSSASHDHTVRLWDVTTGECRGMLEGHAGPVWSVAYHPEGKLLVSGGADGMICFWDGVSHELLRQTSGRGAAVRALAFHPDGDLIASGGGDGEVCLWDVEDGRLFRVLEGHEHSVGSLAFSSDGMVLASASKDRTVRLWDVTTGLGLGALCGHEAEVTGVSFSRDDELLATTSLDRTVRLWSVAKAREIEVLERHEVLTRGIFFHPEGWMHYLTVSLSLKGVGVVSSGGGGTSLVVWGAEGAAWMEKGVFLAARRREEEEPEQETLEGLLAALLEGVPAGRPVLEKRPSVVTGVKVLKRPVEPVEEVGEEGSLRLVHGRGLEGVFRPWSTKERLEGVERKPSLFALMIVVFFLLSLGYAAVDFFIAPSKATLRQGLLDDSSNARQRALRSIYRMGKKAESLLPEVVAAVSDGEIFTQALGVKVLVRVGEPSVGVLLKALKSASDVQKVRLLDALGCMEGVGSSALPEIGKMIYEPEREVAHAATRALGWIGGEESLEWLLKAFKMRQNRRVGPLSLVFKEKRLKRLTLSRRAKRSIFWRLRGDSASRSLLRAFLRLGSGAVYGLSGLLRDSDPLVRRDAARVLGRLKDSAKVSVPSLMLCLGDENALVRKAAIRALGYIGPKASSALSALEGMLEDHRKVHRRDIRLAIMRIRRN